jgi:hypothetical protein
MATESASAELGAGTSVLAKRVALFPEFRSS